MHSIQIAFTSLGFCSIAAFIYLVVRKRNTITKAQLTSNGTIRLHMISETAWVSKGQGVHTAFIELIELLKNDSRLSISINGEGNGDVFHSHTYGPYYFWMGRKYKGRRILTAHVIPDSSKGAIPFWKQLLPLTTWYLKLAYAYADVVIAISPTVESTIKNLGIESKIVLIKNPVLTGKWKRTEVNRIKGRKLLNIHRDEKLVVGVGQLQQRKGVEDFIDIAAAMPDVRFVWVGGRPMGNFTEGIKRIDERIKTAPANLQFTGLLELEEMNAMYAAGDIFLFPSYQENCPLAPLEAAAAGLPVVFRDLVEYKRLFNSNYLKAGTTKEFIDITRKLVDDADFHKYSVNLSEFLLQQFDKDEIEGQLFSLYQQTLNNFLIINQSKN